jgi:hypothetical protein
MSTAPCPKPSLHTQIPDRGEVYTDLHTTHHFISEAYELNYLGVCMCMRVYVCLWVYICVSVCVYVCVWCGSGLKLLVYEALTY